MTKREQAKVIKRVLMRLDLKKFNAWKAQDIDLFNYYSNGWSYFFSVISNSPFESLDAVPERFFRK